MRIGFTGTRQGLTVAQRDELRRLLRNKNPSHFHHGDCIGADRDAHMLVRQLCRTHTPRISIILHPPIDDSQRAFCFGWDIARAPLQYLERNHAIVDETDELIACPQGHEELRSGTWATIRYALRVGKPVTIIMPDGSHARRMPE